MKPERRQEEVRSGRHRERTEESLVLGGFGIILVLGGALMVLLLGGGPAAIGVGIILVVFGVFLMIYKGLGVLEAWLRRE